MATSDTNCNAAFNIGRSALKGMLTILENDMGTIKTGNVIEGWLENMF